MRNIETQDIRPGMTVMAVRSLNNLGQPIRPIRRGDWRRVEITADNLSSYTGGSYLFTTTR